MKQRIALLAMAIVLAASVVSAQWLAVSSGKLSASALVTSGTTYLAAVHVITDGTNAATVTVYDNTSAAGTIVYQVTVDGANYYGGRVWTSPVKLSTGVYCAISGTGAGAFVEYFKR
jgi:hypothetical protein